MMTHDDTIIAPATPPGEGAVAIVRLSGPKAEELLLRFFHPSGGGSLESHRLYHGRLGGPSGTTIDEVMAVVMRAPRTYTRENVVEVHCHGGQALVGRILDLFVDAGARLAGPGEFTLRAFLNGRIDLARAEAVIDLIRSRSEASGTLALRQLEGRLSRSIYELREILMDLAAEVEAWIDFPEDDVPTPEKTDWAGRVGGVLGQINGLLSGFESARVLREGLSILILGPPNVGKSSLLNALLGEARAIVTEIPGTTRDIIEETLVLDGIPLRLVDTAGVRNTTDPIEAEGVRRARDKISGADLVLLVLDGTRAPDNDDRLALELCREKPLLVVVNKVDLGTLPPGGEWDRYEQVRISARTEEGFDTLREKIVGRFRADFSGGEIADSVLVSDRRHRQALVHCRAALQRFVDALGEDKPAEFLAFELGEALNSLGEITGETTPDQLLEQIFSRFCIGK
jgi:tRNA modification GTPase